MKQDLIIILDLGSTDNIGLARAVRSLGVYSEIYPHDILPEKLKAILGVKGVILNGGMNRVVDGEAIDIASEIYNCGIPIIAMDHPAAKCEDIGQWNEGSDSKMASIKTFIFDSCKAEAN